MSNVVPLRKCLCGSPGTPRLMEHDGISTPFYACDTCLDGTLELLARVRPVADAMRACKVREETAEAVMAYLLALIDEDDAEDEDGDPDDAA